MATLQDLLARLVEHEDLTAEETAAVMESVLTDSASPVAMGAFLAALRVKRETATEVAGLAQAMLDHALRFEVPGRTVDIVGTGGDGAHTVNISTMASIVIAGAGPTVVKHGNRAATSKSGSADVLGALGVRLDLPVERVKELATEVGITFCFAQVFHPSMRFAMPIRKELGIPTTFNILGPLTNPAQPQATAIGSSSMRVSPVLAGVVASQGREALVFHGDDGLDELAPTGPATLWEVRGGEISEQRLDPVGDLGLAPITLDELRGGDAEQNAAVVRRVLEGETGPVRDTVALNAAAGLVADATLPGTASGTLVERFSAGLGHAERSIDSGAAREALDRWVAATQS
ncbi:anthranilate phosphoribosyltransferase [Demequina sp. SYSU T00039]|uniref:Anthranilate phosphoribosyltransferase n=1 Tax=Demequina lignilytica TaxID=3051663 RepID=A0AAW7M892_9MICO|nr:MULTISPECIES: anthranilate phosphoribosyltransferase [unclassified Demequina]MDN4486816.1 anthranilate phosphoribosyltransferase [Demequina sp. SYSU T00039]MDN4489500.1 anthranilate phosphoribosyltransferase [Demequina sp. SYSU T00068]